MQKGVFRLPAPAALIAFGAALRFGLLLYAMSFPPVVYDGDSREYLALATNLITEGRYEATTNRPFPPDSVRPPLYPAFLAISLIAGGSPFPALLGQVLLSIAALVLTSQLCRKLGFSEPAGRLALLFLALDISSLIYSITLMSEMLFTVLLLLFAQRFWETLHDPERRNLLALAVLSCGLILTKPIALYLPLVVVGLLLLHRREKMRFGLLRSLAYVTLVVLLILPWVLRNARKHDFPGVSTVQAFNLLYYNGALAMARAEGISIDQAEDTLTAALDREVDLTDSSTGDKAAAMQALGMRTILHYAGDYLLLHVRGMLATLIDPGRLNLARLLYGEQAGSGLLEVISTRGLRAALSRLSHQSPGLLLLLTGGFIWQICLLIMIGGAFVGQSRHTHPFRLVFLLALIMYFVFLTGPIGAARFRVPITPFLVILGGSGAEQWYRKIRMRRNKIFA